VDFWAGQSDENPSSITTCALYDFNAVGVIRLIAFPTPHQAIVFGAEVLGAPVGRVVLEAVVRIVAAIDDPRAPPRPCRPRPPRGTSRTIHQVCHSPGIRRTSWWNRRSPIDIRQGNWIESELSNPPIPPHRTNFFLWVCWRFCGRFLHLATYILPAYLPTYWPACLPHLK
jgi:hypothetical protein